MAAQKQPFQEPFEKTEFINALRNGKLRSEIVEGVLENLGDSISELYDALTGAGYGDWSEPTFRDAVIAQAGELSNLIDTYRSLNWEEFDPVKDNSLTSQ